MFQSKWLSQWVQRSEWVRRDGPYLGGALCLHVALLIGLMWASVSTRQPAWQAQSMLAHHELTPTDTPQPMRAVAVDERAVKAQVAQLRAQQARAERRRVAQQKRWQAAAAKAKRARAQEAARLARLKKQHQQLRKDVARTQVAKQNSQQALAKTQKALQAAEVQHAAMREQAQLKAEADRQAKAQRAAQAAKVQGQEINRYKAMITQKIGRYWLVPNQRDAGLSCQLLIHLAPGGTVLRVEVARSSGNAVLDRSARSAVLKASPLPVPTSTAMFNQFRDLRLTVRPEMGRSA